MLPTINGKDLIDCSLDDLQEILDNPDFMENEYIDYKKAFAINEVHKEQVQHEKAEFRSDVCSFANASGGYLIFGVKEEKGIAKEFLGISLPFNNPDKFELELKNILQAIEPRVPYYKIKYLPMSENKYIVILFIQHDSFAPYIHLVEHQNYRAFKRAGNSKVVIEYQEMKRMFTQSLSIEKEMNNFREERISFYLSQEDNEKHEYSKFLLLHIIPDTFLDLNYNKIMYIWMKQDFSITGIFNAFRCTEGIYPMVDGIKLTKYDDHSEGRIYNNRVAELFYPLYNCVGMGNEEFPFGVFHSESLWDDIKSTVNRYIEHIGINMPFSKIFVCISIIGCKGAVTDLSSGFDYSSVIDRSKLMCPPTMFENSNNNNSREKTMDFLEMEYLLSLGIRHNSRVKTLISEMSKELDS